MLEQRDSHLSTSLGSRDLLVFSMPSIPLSAPPNTSKTLYNLLQDSKLNLLDDAVNSSCAIQLALPAWNNVLRYFSTSLCGVLVFRLDPAAPVPDRSRRRSLIPQLITTHHSSTSHTSLITSQHSSHNTHPTTLIPQLITPQLIKAPHKSHLAHHSSTSHHNSSRLHFSHFTYRITTHHSSTSHTSLITSQHSSHNSSHHNSSKLLTTHHSSSQLINPHVRKLRLPFAWQAQYTEPPGGAAARVGATGPRLALVWQAQYTEPAGGAAVRVGAAGPRLALVWQAQYTERPGGAAARVGAAGPRLALMWQTQKTEPPGGAARPRVAGAVYRASGGSAARRRWAAAASRVRVAGAAHRAARRSCGARGRRWAAAGCTQSLPVELRRAWSPLGRGCFSCGRRSTLSLSRSVDVCRWCWATPQP